MKKILTFILIITVSFSMVFSIPQKTEAKNVTSWIGKGVFYLAQKTVNKYYSKKAYVHKGAYGSTVSPGTVKFNQKKTGASVKYPVHAQAKGHSVALYYTASPVFWGFHGALILTNSKGKDIINKSVSANQQFKGYKFPKKGDMLLDLLSLQRLVQNQI